MFKILRPLRPYRTEIANANALYALALAQSSEPMTTHALVLGAQLAREDFKRKYEDALLVLAFSVSVNIGVIIWFTIKVANEFVSF